MEQARFNMIEQQIRPCSVLDDTVLQTMASIPREAFAPESLASLAYADIELPLAHDEAMMFPRIEGRMLQELEISIDDECLEVGTGSAYVTACMANMSKIAWLQTKKITIFITSDSKSSYICILFKVKVLN